MSQNIIEMRNVTKQFSGEVVLKGININVKKGEFLTILGPSGCGKTTTLNIINGKEKLDSGSIFLNGKDLSKIPMNKRSINTIFQNYALFSHMTVFENIAYGPVIKKIKYDNYAPEVKKFLDLVGLNGFEDKNIEELSGGQQQRVAMARALINKPDVLLLDEPLAALDVQLRKKMQVELKKIQEEIGITFIFITHDQEEALTLSDRIILMKDGLIQQVGTPEDVYNEPENIWVAKFIGSSNIISDATFIKDNLIKFDNKKFKTLDRGFGKDETNIDVVIRPEDIDIVKVDKGFFNGVIKSVQFKGVHWEIVVKCASREYLVHTTDYKHEDEEVAIKWNIEDLHTMWKEIDD